MVDTGAASAAPGPKDGPGGVTAPEGPEERVETRAGRDDTRTSAYVTRRAFVVLASLALLAVVIAVVVNWLFLPERTVEVARDAEGNGAGLVDVIDDTEPVDAALALIPSRIIQFDPVTVQPVPGLEAYAAEGVFRTLQMNVESQIPTLVYVRAEVLGSAAEADARLAQLMASYTLSAGQVQLGGTVARQGWTPDQGAYARAWTSGVNVTFVKASFPDWIPEHHFEIIERQGIAVSEAVEVFQRTGLEGVQAQ